MTRHQRSKTLPYHAQQVVLHHVSVPVVIIQPQSVGDHRQIDRVRHGQSLCTHTHTCTCNCIGSAGSTSGHGNRHAEIRGVDGVAHFVQQCLQHAVQLGLVQVAVTLGGTLVQVERRPTSCTQTQNLNEK